LFPAENLIRLDAFPRALPSVLGLLSAETHSPELVLMGGCADCAANQAVAIKEVTFILVVEDSEDNREILRYILRASGYGVLEAMNGEQAVEICRSKHPDLILMDLSMPVLDGYGAVEQIRQLHELDEVPIIAISAHATIDYRSKALSNGFNDYLTKPIDFAQLETLLHRYLKGAG